MLFFMVSLIFLHLKNDIGIDWKNLNKESLALSFYGLIIEKSL